MSTSPSQGSPFFFSLFRKWIKRERNSLRSLVRPPFFSFFFYIVSDIFHVVFVFLIIFFFYTFFVMNFYTDTRNYNWFHSRYTRGEYLRAKRKKKKVEFYPRGIRSQITFSRTVFRSIFLLFEGSSTPRPRSISPVASLGKKERTRPTIIHPLYSPVSTHQTAI